MLSKFLSFPFFKQNQRLINEFEFNDVEIKKFLTSNLFLSTRYTPSNLDFSWVSVKRDSDRVLICSDSEDPDPSSDFASVSWKNKKPA